MPDKPQVEIVGAFPADIPALVSLIVEGIEHCGLPEEPLDTDTMRRRLELILTSSQHLLLVFRSGGAFVGYAHAFAAPQWQADTAMVYVPHFYVREGYRSYSLWSQAMDRFAEWTREIGAKWMSYLTANGIMGPAHDRMLKRKGFHPVGTMYERAL